MTRSLFLWTTIMLSFYRSSLAVKRFGGLWSVQNLPKGGNLRNSLDKIRGKSTQATPKSSSILSFPQEHPFAFQLIVATAKTSAADLVAQVVAERKSWDQIDWNRNALFVIFGFAYLGGFQYYLMVHKYRHWFPTMDKFAKMSLSEKLAYPAGIIDAMKMVIFDVTIHLPLIYFPCYYAVKEFVGGNSWNPIDWFRNGLTKYSKNCESDLTAMLQVWFPSDCIQFMLPVYIRLPFRHLVSFFWTAYVSFTRGAMEPAAPTPPAIES